MFCEGQCGGIPSYTSIAILCAAVLWPFIKDFYSCLKSENNIFQKGHLEACRLDFVERFIFDIV